MMTRLFLVFAIAFSSLLLISINLSPTFAAQNIHWRYSGAENPTQWGKLSKDFELCELGESQSPININGTVSSSPANINFDYKPSPIEIDARPEQPLNNRTVQLHSSESKD